MKLRYQMRGLGIGIIVTALLMGVAMDDGVPLTDAEIKILAAELGMVESDSLKLSDVQQGSSVTPTETPTAEPVIESTQAPTTEPTIEPTMAPTEQPTTEPTAEPTEVPSKEPETGDVIILEVNRGSNSYTVSLQLEEAGLVADANEFDRYLCTNGYAECIQVGNFEIAVGSTLEEIAKIITKTK